MGNTVSRLRVFGEQQRRDQIAREDEEEIDAEPAACQMARMEEHDAQHSGAANAVECGKVLQFGTRRRRCAR